MSENANVELLRGDPKKAINKLAYPIIGSLLLVMLNNIIDSVWVAGLGSDPCVSGQKERETGRIPYKKTVSLKTKKDSKLVDIF